MFIKKIVAKTLLLATFAFASFSCVKYDDAAIKQQISDLTDRVEAVESWQIKVNTDVANLKSLITALEAKNYITSVVPIEGGYTIKFKTGSDITIHNGTDGTDGTDGVNGADGKDGVAPKIGFKSEGGVNYWTLDGEFILDDSDAKLPVNGADGVDGAAGAAGADAIAPQLRINSDTNEWEISADGGKTWASTGVKATGAAGTDGASFFESVDAKSSEEVVFTLTDGTTFSIPILKEVSLSFALNRDKPFDLNCSKDKYELNLTIDGLEADDVKAVTASIIHPIMGLFTSVVTKDPSQNKITVTGSSFSGKTGSASLEIATDKFDKFYPGEPSLSGVLRVSVLDNSNNEYSVTHAVTFWENMLEGLAASKHEATYTLTENEICESDPFIVESGTDLTINLDCFDLILPRIVVEDGASLTIDGGDFGHLYLKNATTDYGIKLSSKEGSLTIKNASVFSENMVAAICIGDEFAPEASDNVVTIDNAGIVSYAGSAIVVCNRQKITITSTDFSAQMYGVIQNGSIAGSTYYLEKCEFETQLSSIYLSNTVDGQANNLTIKHCALGSTKGSPIEVKKTNLTIYDRTFLRNMNPLQSYTVAESGSNSCGYGIVLAGCTLGVAYEGEVSIDSSTSYDLEAGSSAVKVLIYKGAADGHGEDYYL